MFGSCLYLHSAIINNSLVIKAWPVKLMLGLTGFVALPRQSTDQVKTLFVVVGPMGGGGVRGCKLHQESMSFLTKIAHNPEVKQWLYISTPFWRLFSQSALSAAFLASQIHLSNVLMPNVWLTLDLAFIWLSMSLSSYLLIYLSNYQQYEANNVPDNREERQREKESEAFREKARLN